MDMDSKSMEMSALLKDGKENTEMDGSNDATCSATVPTADTSEIQRYLYYMVHNMYYLVGRIQFFQNCLVLQCR